MLTERMVVKEASHVSVRSTAITIFLPSTLFHYFTTSQNGVWTHFFIILSRNDDDDCQEKDGTMTFNSSTLQIEREREKERNIDVEKKEAGIVWDIASKKA